MEQKATVTLDYQTFEIVNGKQRPLPFPLAKLTIDGELLPNNEQVHHILAALLDKSDPPEVLVKFSNKHNVLTYSVTFTHDKDVLAQGAESHRVTLKARDKNMSVAEVKAAEKAEANALAKAQAETAKAAE